MADVLTHVLVGYIVGVSLSFRYDWIKTEQVTLVMLGALAPDFMKIGLFVPDGYVAHLLGVPFSWSPLHTLVGTVIVISLISLLLAPEYRKGAIILLAIGVATHLVLDIALLTPTGEAYAVFWPLSSYRPPSGGLYLSTDRWPALVAATIAVALWAGRRYRSESAASSDL
ncbi:metal-dependent hydrolase [Halobacteria archaeon AArc-curdl1]|uniref:Metal-dependent hydrolase n=1 Tax=Natronosalvus hydrolyticus TaxID=2979988 RepID=A0AAP2ZBT5_9EURY|nr:metal-dependent hydrolase [Halobacteria archaeon AArc-curdl1]